MSAQLSEIKKKISSTKNTKKITLAMQLESSSKMKGFQDKALSVRSYSLELMNLQKQLINNPYIINSEYSQKRNSSKILFILYSSDKGLCGSLNSQMGKTLFESNLWSETKDENRILLTIGKKGTSYAKYNGYKVDKSFEKLSEKPTNIEILEIVSIVLEYWKNKDIKKVVMVTPHYKNSLIFYPILKTFLPFSEEMYNQFLSPKNIELIKTDEKKEMETERLYEPSLEIVSEKLMQNVILAVFKQSFFELKASEYSSRMIAMKNATDAAEDMIDSLTLTFNKARQTAITQEIAEIVAGASI